MNSIQSSEISQSTGPRNEAIQSKNRLWIVELIYVYPLGKEMILNEYKDQKTFRTAYRQWVAAKDEQALVTFHEARFFRDLQSIKIKHDMMHKKPVDGWFQYDYVLDLAEETEKQFTVIG